MLSIQKSSAKRKHNQIKYYKSMIYKTTNVSTACYMLLYVTCLLDDIWCFGLWLAKFDFSICSTSVRLGIYNHSNLGTMYTCWPLVKVLFIPFYLSTYRVGASSNCKNWKNQEVYGWYGTVLNEGNNQIEKIAPRLERLKVTFQMLVKRVFKYLCCVWW